MSTKTRQRRRYADEFKRQVVAESFDPEISVAEIARRYEMNANAFFNWRKDPRFNPALAEREPIFLPVEIRAQDHAPVTTGPAAEAPIPPEAPSTSPSPIEIALVCGTRLRVGSHVEEAALTRVIRAIGAAA